MVGLGLPFLWWSGVDIREARHAEGQTDGSA
jgi:hypothetical protein